MSEQTILQLTRDHDIMTKQSTRLVIGLTVIIHILLNVYARMNDDDFLKIEIPVMSAVTFLVVFLAFRLGKGKGATH